LRGEKVRGVIFAARKRGGDKVADLEKSARVMVDRMAANFNPLMVLKLMGWVMSNVFHRLYQAVFLNEKDLAILRKVSYHRRRTCC